MSETIRIKTNVGTDSDKYLKIKLEQKFDFIEVLSLNISMDKEGAYRNFCSDYGAVVGRVVINSGFGVPNVKVSIFIPLDSIDSQDPHISGLYPYNKVTDKNNEGIRYNLLPRNSDSQDPCYTPVGTFPTKREVLDNDDMLYVYKKYYKFTTTTNYAGDFMLFGVPVGNHIVHVDMDISNIGIASQKPYDLIAQGAPTSMFYSPTKFKKSTNLNSLPQIKTANASVNVQPFWGDLDNCQIGINRLDFDMNYNITPAAIFTGSIFGDHEKNSINKRCLPRIKSGVMSEQETGSGTIEMIRKTPDNRIESFDINGGELIDDDGTWAYQIPMNLDYMITAEDGTLIPSSNPNFGIPTRARVRFRIGMNESGDLGRLRTRAKYLVPNNPATYNDLDLNFDDTTKDSSFTDFYWNKIYTIKNYIPRFNRDSWNGYTPRYLGIKDVDKSSNVNRFPYNNTFRKGTTINQIIFTVVCIINTYIAYIVSPFNLLLSGIATIGFDGPFGISFHPFGFLCGLMIGLNCTVEDKTNIYYPGATGTCKGINTGLDDFINCIAISLATRLESYQMDFYNDWINGTLYSYLLKYKRKNNGKEKYCDANCGNDDNPCLGSVISYWSLPSVKNQELTPNDTQIYQGLIIKYNGILYYSPITTHGYKLFTTDITNLGAVSNCDWQLFPKIINYLSPTSYKLPPIIQELDTAITPNYIESGIFNLNVNSDGLFFNVNCLNRVVPSTYSSLNIKRQCELGVDIPEWTGKTSTINYINVNQIYDNNEPAETSIHKYIRDSFTLLNIDGSGISRLPNYSLDAINGTSFSIGVDYNEPSNINGNLYYKFANYWNVLGGSYYTYFGLNPGKTAYDKLKKKYFTDCPLNINDNYSISVNVFSTSTLSSNDGTIIFNFIGGVPPFSAIIQGENYPSTQYNTTNTPIIVNGVSNGVYKIIATDALGTVVTRDVVVSGPQRLTAFVRIISNPVTDTSNNGQISLYYLSGGTPDYTLKLTNTSTNTTFGPYKHIKQDTVINNLTKGVYSLIISDSSTPEQTETLSVTLTPPPPLQAIFSHSDSNDTTVCTGVGSITVVVNGGSPPYTLSATSNNGYFSGGTYGDVNFNYLYGGNYKVQVKDISGTIITENINIAGNSKFGFRDDVSYGYTYKTNINPVRRKFLKLPYKRVGFYQTEDILVTGGTYSTTIQSLYVGGNLKTYNYSPAPVEIRTGAYSYEYGWILPANGSILTISATSSNGCVAKKDFKL